VVVRLDIKNACNELKRAAALKRLNDSPHLHALVPLFWATHAPRIPVYLSVMGLERADFDSAEGLQQGDGPASVSFCAGIHPEVVALDVDGGAARFIMDDGYAIGPASVVFDAVRRFGEAIAVLGVELQEDKSECYSPNGPVSFEAERPPLFPLGAARHPDGSVLGYGIKVGGVPVGDPVYVQHTLERKAEKAVSKIIKISDVLRPLHLQSLYCATY
jgi:hypothetical protein